MSRSPTPTRIDEAARDPRDAGSAQTVQRSPEGAELSVRRRHAARTRTRRSPALIAAGIELADFSMGQPSLDEVFFALTGQPASDDGNKEAAA